MNGTKEASGCFKFKSPIKIPNIFYTSVYLHIQCIPNSFAFQNEIPHIHTHTHTRVRSCSKFKLILYANWFPTNNFRQHLRVQLTISAWADVTEMPHKGGITSEISMVINGNCWFERKLFWGDNFVWTRIWILMKWQICLSCFAILILKYNAGVHW